MLSPATISYHPAAPPHRQQRPALKSGQTEGWDLMLVFLAAYVLTSVGRIHQLFEVLVPLHLAVISSAGAATLFLIDRNKARRIGPSLASPVIRFVLAFWLWVALSVPAALNQGIAFEMFVNVGRTAALAVVVVSAIRSARDVSRLAEVYFASAVLYSAVILSRFQLGAGDQWRLGSLYYYDANDFATFAVTGIPIGIYLVFRRGAPFKRAAALVGLGILTIGIVWSGSRGGFLALLATTLFLLFRFTTVRAVWRVAAVVGLTLILLRTASDTYWTQMQTISSPSKDYNMTDETGRVEIWKRGMGYTASHPLFGVGANNFPVAEGMLASFAGRQAYGAGVRWNAAHNSFVQTAAELGVPGFLFFTGIIVSALLSLRSATRRSVERMVSDEDAHALTQALTASLVGFIVGIFFLSMAYHEVLYSIAAMAAGMLKVSSVKANHPLAARGTSRARVLTGRSNG